MGDQDRVRAAVRAFYSALARQGSEPCCGPAPSDASSCCAPEQSSMSCCSPALLYDTRLLGGLPVDMAGASLGCGDPVTIAELKPGQTVLDLGSGAGLDCFLAARQVGEAGRVIGVDMTPEMIARAEANRARLTLHNVEFRPGSIEALPVEDSGIDVVISNCVINLSPDKPAVFREAFRVLKPGGRLALSDIVTEGDFGPEVRARLDLWAACVSGAVDIGEYLAMLFDAGFVDVEVQDRATVYEPQEPVPSVPRIFSARITACKPDMRTDAPTGAA